MEWASDAVRKKLVKTLMPRFVERLRNIQSNGPTLTLSVKNSTNVLSEVPRRRGKRMAKAMHVRQKMLRFKKINEYRVDERFEDFTCDWEKTD